jgi:PIN domain nuclease of toxin-antitoxin system
VRFLLDTHSFLWFLSGDKRMSSTARTLIGDSDNEALLSKASLWEIAIKAGLGKLSLAKPFAELIPEQLRENAIEVLPIEVKDLALVADLPFHHRDPFDRLILAQAIARRLPIVGKDPEFVKYAVELLW